MSDHHLHLGKMNDRYAGPYYVITVFDNGVIRVKEEARPNMPPKMVHHDRVRRFIQEEPNDTPPWVRDAIAAFERRMSKATQTDEAIAREVISPTETATVMTCVCCEQSRLDKYGLIRVFNHQRECHLCYDFITRFTPTDMNVVDDVTDHDLLHV